MPRPRTATNAEIVEGTLRAISRIGASHLRLADVAAEVGLAPATLIQRFGSKRALLLAVVEHGVQSVESCFDTVRAANPSPLQALLAAATDITRHVQSPESLANHLAFLQIDLSDPDFHRLALQNSHRVLAGYRALITDAIASGELAPCDAEGLARTTQAVTSGSLINWAIHRQGPVLDWVRRDLEGLLQPYRLRSASISGAPLRSTGPRARHTTGGGPAVSPEPAAVRTSPLFPRRRSGV